MKEFEDIDRMVAEQVSYEACSMCGEPSEGLLIRYSFRDTEQIASWLEGMKRTGPFKPLAVYCAVVSKNHTEVYLPMCEEHFHAWADSYDHNHRGLAIKHDAILERGRDY